MKSVDSEFLGCGCDYGYMDDEIRGDTDLPVVDLVMWVKDSADTLPVVLRSINRVVPAEFVNQRLIVDDNSRDLSCVIAEGLGWRVISNRGKGISDAANTALKYVVSKRFCSFEHDLVLSPDWFSRVVSLVKGDVVVASGVRMPFSSKSLKDIGLYEASRFRGSSNALFGRTLDNTCFNTEFMRSIGGFPDIGANPGVDVTLFKKVRGAGKLWVVDSSVCSNHLRRGIRDELRHYYWYGSCQGQVNRSLFAYFGLLGRALFSPVRGLDIAVSRRDLACVWVYPALRFSSLAGAVWGLVR